MKHLLTTTAAPFRHLSIFSFLLVFLLFGCSQEKIDNSGDTNRMSKADALKELKIPALSQNQDLVKTNGGEIEEEIEVEGEEIIVESDLFDIREKSEFKLKYKNGEIEGTFYWEDFDLYTGESFDWANGDVICVKLVDEHTANIAGYVTDALNPALLGTYAIWTAIDNDGDGDYSTLILTGSPKIFADYHCEYGFTLPNLFSEYTEFIEGKVKVKAEYKVEY